MPVYTYPLAIGFLVVALLLLWRGLSNILTSDLHKMRGRVQIFLGVVFFIGCVLLVVAKISFVPYTAIPKNRPIAHLEFEADSADFSHTVTITFYGDIPRRYKMNGDQWHVQMRAISWSDELTEYGFVPMFQVTELASSYSVARTESQERANNYDLHKNSLINIDALYQGNSDKLNFMRVVDVSSDKIPFINTAAYDLYLEKDGSVRTELLFQ